jgi:aspartate carbamoyltransferase catalytic subunit
MKHTPQHPQDFDYPKHLLSTERLSASDIHALLELATGYYTRNREIDKKHPILRGLTLINLFYENSTRTRTSFELAGKRLGMDVVNISGSGSSASKGENLLDSARTLNAMQPDAIVIRHAASGSAELIARHIDCKVINAGDGSHQHPTQALLDAFTITRRKGDIRGLTIAICGDVAHSRVARSNIALLKTMGANVRLIAPPQLMPSRPEQLGCTLHYSLDEGLKDADVVMMLRVQTERMQGAAIPTIREYFTRFGLSHARLAHAKPDVLVLHPGPINRGVEITGELADDLEKNAILDQVEAGVAVRQAILEKMLT